MSKVVLPPTDSKANGPSLVDFFKFFFFFFWRGPFFKYFIEFVTSLLLYVLLFFGYKHAGS